MSSGKCRPFCLGLNVLKVRPKYGMNLLKHYIALGWHEHNQFIPSAKNYTLSSL